jgi:hypothetical protein
MNTARDAKNVLAISPLGLAALLLSAFLTVVGCGNPVVNIPEFTKKDLALAAIGNAPSGEFFYRLVPYDSINVKFTYHPEEDTKVPLMIRPDGNITLVGSGVV